MPFRSGTTYRAFRDLDCAGCFTTIEKGEEYGYVDGEMNCEFCWDAVGLEDGWGRNYEDLDF